MQIYRKQYILGISLRRNFLLKKHYLKKQSDFVWLLDKCTFQVTRPLPLIS